MTHSLLGQASVNAASVAVRELRKESLSVNQKVTREIRTARQEQSLILREFHAPNPAAQVRFLHNFFLFVCWSSVLSFICVLKYGEKSDGFRKIYASPETRIRNFIFTKLSIISFVHEQLEWIRLKSQFTNAVIYF